MNGGRGNITHEVTALGTSETVVDNIRPGSASQPSWRGSDSPLYISRWRNSSGMEDLGPTSHRRSY